MIVKHYYLIVLFLFFSFPVKSQIPEPFKEDCPDNSRCSPIGAKAYQMWEEVLKPQRGLVQPKILESISHRAGIPIPFWSSKKEVKPVLPFLSWDSSCPNHRTPNPEFFLSLIFIPQTSPQQLKAVAQTLYSEGFMLDLAAIKLGTSQYKLWPIPRGETPLYLKKEGGQFIADFEGHYFYYHFSYQGLNQPIKIQSQNEIAKNIPPATIINCSPDLVQFYQKNLSNPSWAVTFYCKSIWDKDAHLFREVIFGKGCS